jgi:pimeloyl-ACP methyl ester carboxylesterase
MPLVLTHGALLSLEAWALLGRPLLAAGHQVIAYDLRGHGPSTLGRSGFGGQAYAQDLAAVLDHFDVRRGAVVAHSTGGIGALALVVGAPADTARLAGQVLISTAPQASATVCRTGCWLRSCSRAWPTRWCVGAGWARCSPAPWSAPTLTRIWWSSPAASWQRRHDRRPSTRPKQCCGSTSGIGSTR